MDFTTVAGLVHEVTEARVDKRLLNHQKRAVAPQTTDHRRDGLIPIRHDRAIIHRCVPEPHPSFPRKRQSTAIGERDCGVIKAKWY